MSAPFSSQPQSQYINRNPPESAGPPAGMVFGLQAMVVGRDCLCVGGGGRPDKFCIKHPAPSHSFTHALVSKRTVRHFCPPATMTACRLETARKKNNANRPLPQPHPAGPARRAMSETARPCFFLPLLLLLLLRRPPAQPVTQKQAAPTRHGVINTRTRGPSIAAAAKRAKSSTALTLCLVSTCRRAQPCPSKAMHSRQVSALRAQITPEITSLGFWGATSPPRRRGASPRTSPSAVPNGAVRTPSTFPPVPNSPPGDFSSAAAFLACKGAHSDHTGRGALRRPGTRRMR